MVFALEGGRAAPIPDASTCEEACPVVDSIEELLCGGALDPKRQLIRHLNHHLREALIECGMFDLMAAQPGAPHTVSADDAMKLRQVNQRLAEWHCQVKLDEQERRLLHQSLSRLPRSSWITMPRMLWRLKKKLKRTEVSANRA
jgi:thiamine kinase-like enzyme